jgi:N-acetylmuramoyl-L-alanine amidase
MKFLVILYILLFSLFSYNEEKSFTVIIDPSHGGNDIGAKSVNGIKEKDITLEISLMLKEKLEKEKINVILTRDKDVALSYEERAYIANHNKGNIFISIHANFSYNSDTNGFAIIYSKKEETISFSLPYYDKIQQKYYKKNEYIANQIRQALLEFGSPIWEIKEAPLYIFKGIDMPAVLIELGFLSNENDVKNLLDHNWRNKFVELLSQVIINLKNE